jgi:hypothetical protein
MLEFTKRLKDTTTHIRLGLDRLVGEAEKDRSKIHLLSVIGGDADVGAIWAAINDESHFTLRGPGIEPMTGSLGADAQCFRGTLTLAGRRPIRHLVAISAEVARTRPGADREGNRTVLCNDDPTFVLYRMAQRFGLPVVPEWADWFNAELRRRGAIRPLIGLGCTPVLVTGTKKIFLKWIGRALRRKQIRFPEENGPICWTQTQSFFRVSEDDSVALNRIDEVVAAPAIPGEEDQSCV